MDSVIRQLLADLRGFGFQFVDAGWARVNQLVDGGGIFDYAAALFIVLYALFIFFGLAKFSVEDLIKNLLFVAFVYILVSSSAVHGSLYLLLANDIPSFGASIIPPQYQNGGQGIQGIEAGLSEVFSRGIEAGSRVARAGGSFSLGPAFVAALIWAGTLIFVGMSLLLFGISFIALAILIIFMPLFAVCLFFKPTRGLFQAWLGHCIEMALMPMLGCAVMAFFVHITRILLVKIEQVPEVAAAEAFPFFLVTVIAGVILWQIPKIAAHIGGGTALSSMGVVSAMYGRAQSAVNSGIASYKRRGQTRDPGQAGVGDYLVRGGTALQSRAANWAKRFRSRKGA